MEVKEKRHKVEERKEFTDQQKSTIAAKSDDRCAWCGKKVYFGYGGTVDHFVPLQKGGTNEFDNLVLMCKSCNEKKGSMVITPSVGGMHLKEEFFDRLANYYDNYCKTFDYISRGNLLAADIYGLYLLPEAVADADDRLRRKGKKLHLNYKQPTVLLRRAYPDDEQRICDYYTKYLKKHKMLNSKEAAIQNVKFWMRFGAIYFVEKSGEVNVMSTMLINKHGYLSINLFPYYSTLQAYTLTRGIVSTIGNAMVSENELPFIPVSVNMLKADSLHPKVLTGSSIYGTDGVFICCPYALYSDDYIETVRANNFHVDSEAREEVQKFMHRFKDIEGEISIYLYENNLLNHYDWMADEMIKNNLFKNFNF